MTSSDMYSNNSTFFTYTNGTQYVVETNVTNVTENTPSDLDPGQVSALAFTIQIIFMLIIISMAITGNVLVLVSVYKFERLQYISNAFIVSLACADLTVALTVMPFNAFQVILQNRWIFGQIVCDLYNANDVFFSTASLLHLCCISIDRFLGVTHPLTYSARMTMKRAGFMLAIAWSLSAALSHIPIHMGWYTTPEHRLVKQNGGQCLFTEINIYYALISSSTSFWIPATIMVSMYAVVFRIARKQERLILEQTKMLERFNNNNNNGDIGAACGNDGDSDSRRRLSKERKAFTRENRAAKTLGFLMAVFLCCWLPFFIWYVATNLCGDACPELPEYVMFVMFWLGYMNSALNPMVYAWRNKQFRDAFYDLLRCDSLQRLKTSTCCQICIPNSWSRRQSRLEIQRECADRRERLSRKVSTYSMSASSQECGNSRTNSLLTENSSTSLLDKTNSPSHGRTRKLSEAMDNICKYDIVHEAEEHDVIHEHVNVDDNGTTIENDFIHEHVSDSSVPAGHDVMTVNDESDQQNQPLRPQFH